MFDDRREGSVRSDGEISTGAARSVNDGRKLTPFRRAGSRAIGGQFSGVADTFQASSVALWVADELMHYLRRHTVRGRRRPARRGEEV